MSAEAFRLTRCLATGRPQASLREWHSEAGALFAFVGLFLFADAVWGAIPAAVAFGSTLVAAPTRGRIESMRPATKRRSLG